MTAHIVPIVGAAVILSICGSASMGRFLTCKRDRDAEMKTAWHDIRLRNGVTAVSPWHEPNASVNIPALVEVRPPARQVDPPLHPWEVSVMPESKEGTTVPAVEPLVNEPPAPLLELGEKLTPEETARVSRLYAAGVGKHATIEQVWGVKKGGSKRFKLACKRYEEIKSEVLTNA